MNAWGKKEQNNTFAATWMDLETVILSEVNQTEKEKCYCTYMESNLETKMIQMELFIKQKQTYRY